jgi:3',5'-cyclic AMP phosphodiesterase CpdA
MSSYTFRLAHLSDLHVGPLPVPSILPTGILGNIWSLAKGERPPALMRGNPIVDEINISKFNVTELMGKRLTGYWNWKRSRHAIHNMPMLDAIIEDIKAQNLNHIALTGDLVNIGLPAEFANAESIIKRIANPQNMSLIPGNHDAYCRNSLPAMLHHFGSYMRGDDVEEVTFPYMRIRGKAALIGVSSAIPTAPFLASGAVGKTQMERTRQMLEAAGNASFLRVVMIHHPPYSEGAHFGRGLRDAPTFMKMLREAGAELVIHGHNHVQSIEMHERRNGAAIPIIGVASSSAVPGTAQHKAAYHIYKFTVNENGASLEMVTRGSVDGGLKVSEIERRVII